MRVPAPLAVALAIACLAHVGRLDHLAGVSALLACEPLACEPASSAKFTGARYDAPFFVFDGGSQGEGLGQFDAPGGIADVGFGLIAISDTRNMRIKIVSVEGYFQDFWGDESDTIRLPLGLAADGRGSVWVASSGSDRVVKLRLARDRVSELTGGVELSLGGHGRGNGKFDRPTGVAVDSRSRLYVVDAGNRRVQRFSARGRFARAWSAGLAEPFGIAVDRQDRVYVTDAALHRVQKFDADGRLLAQWGRQGSGPGELDRPLGLAVDADGFVYVADSGNHRVQKFTADGRFVASAGCRGSGAGEFREPTAVAIDEARHLYVADAGNHRVQKLGHQ